MKRRSSGLLGFIRALALLLALSAHAGAAELGEYEIKSGMLYNFTNFVELPADSLDKSGTLNICVTGDSGSGRPFHKLQGRQIKERKIVVRQLQSAENNAGCNLLFIQGTAMKPPSYLRAAQRSGILTVGESDGFAAGGGIIGFYEQDGRVRFEINLEAAQQSRIRINSQLLKLARIVTGHRQ